MRTSPAFSLRPDRIGSAAARVIVLVAAMLLAAPAVLALTSDSEQPIHIEADSAEADDVRHVTIYRGDVVLTQGTLRITGETLTIHYDEDSDLRKLVTLGRPARFRQLPDGFEDHPSNYQTANAKRMEYYAGKDLIVLLGDAVYGEGGDRVAAERIVYDSRRARMRAEASPPASGARKETDEDEKRSRVRIKIVPKKQEQQ